jgi:CheY-like chemotaxis protein
MTKESDFDNPELKDEANAEGRPESSLDSQIPAGAVEPRFQNEPEEKESENYGRGLSRRKTVLLIEDDPFVARDYGDWIRAQHFQVSFASDVHQAILHAQNFRHFDFVVVDIKMLPGKLFTSYESVAGTKTGVLLADELVNYLPDATFMALTNSDRADDQAWFEARGFDFHVKRDMGPQRFATYLRRRAMREKPKVFIVHGHDRRAVRQLKSYLQNVLKFEEPVVLWEQKSAGTTVIEKLERFAEEAEIVFVLMTPDDYVKSKGRGRARQNVLLEYGFFLGRLRRNSGRVILLYKRGVEMPTDLSGIVAIDISKGILAVGHEIQRELPRH